MKVRIEEIRLQNYCAYESARLRLEDLTFLVGRNGAGKSSLLDAVDFIREALTDSVPNALDRRDGLNHIIHAGAHSRAPLGLSVVMTAVIGSQSFRLLYGFRLHRGKGGIEERLLVEGKSTQGFTRNRSVFAAERLSPALTHDRLVLPVIAGEDELTGLVWGALSNMRVYDLSPSAIVAGADIRERTNLERDGGNAADVLNDVLSRRGDHEFVCRFLGAVTDGIEWVGTSVAMRKRFIQARRKAAEGTQTFTSLQLSSGTLRSLGVLLALRQVPRPSLVLIDEIEDSVHPLAVDALLEAVESCLDEFPVILTTHSTEVLARRHATGPRIRLVRWGDGVSRLHRLAPGTLSLIDPVTSAGYLLSTNGLAPATPDEAAPRDILEW